MSHTEIARKAADAELARQRFLSQNKLKSTWESIFTRYARDFTGVADEIDAVTGEVVVDNGHLRGMEDVEEEEDSEGEKGEGEKGEGEERRRRRRRRGRGKGKWKGEGIKRDLNPARENCDTCRDRDELDDSVCRYCTPRKKSNSGESIGLREPTTPTAANKDTTINKADVATSTITTTTTPIMRGNQSSVLNWSPHKIHTYLRHIGALPDHPNSYCELAFQFEKHSLDGATICGDAITVDELRKKLGLESFSDRMMVWAGILRLKKMAATGEGRDPTWEEEEGEKMLAGGGANVRVTITKSPAHTEQDADPWAPPPEPEDPFYSPIWRDEHPDGTPKVFPSRSVDPIFLAPATVKKGKRKKDPEGDRETPAGKKMKTSTGVKEGASGRVTSTTVTVEVPGKTSDLTETGDAVQADVIVKADAITEADALVEADTAGPETPARAPAVDPEVEKIPATDSPAAEIPAAETPVIGKSDPKRPAILETPAPKHTTKATRETPATKPPRHTGFETPAPKPTPKTTPVGKSVTRAFKTPLPKSTPASATKKARTPRVAGATPTPKKKPHARTPKLPPTPGWTTSVDRAKMQGRSFLGYADDDDELSNSPITVAQKVTKLVPIKRAKSEEGKEVAGGDAGVGKEGRHMCGRGFCFICLDLEGEEDDLI